MFGTETSVVYGTIYALLTLAVSVFALTSLDTGTRLSRFMFSELFLKKDEATYKDAEGVRKALAHPLVGTAIMVIIGHGTGRIKLKPDLGSVRRSEPVTGRYCTDGCGKDGLAMQVRTIKCSMYR